MKTLDRQDGGQIRRQVSGIFVAATLLVGWSVVAVQWQVSEIDRLAEANVSAAAEHLIWLSRIIAFALCLFTLSAGAWIWSIGRRASRANQFPPPGVDLIGARTIQTGRKAVWIGRFSQLAGIALFVLGSISAWLLMQLAQILLPR
jgi:hypothetical protein